MPRVSIVIPTKNRPNLLGQCLDSFHKNCPKKYLVNIELIIINQGKNQGERVVDEQIRYYSLSGNLSQARNFAMRITKTPLVAFVDDDCLFTKKYFTALTKLNLKLFESNRVAVVFGPTMPDQPQKHPGLECASVFPKKFTNWRDYISGNNMIVIKKYFMKIGEFKTWLGKGSGGYSGEDTEFILNCIRNGYQIGYRPNLLLYHNHWLSQGDYVIRCRYYCGGIAAYAYHYFLGSQECLPYLRQYLRWTKWAVKENLKIMIKKPLKTLFSSLICIYLGFKGLALGFYYARIAVNENRH